MPCRVSQTSLQQTMNGVVAAIDGAEPKDEIEAMLVSEMAVTHSLAMEGGPNGPSIFLS
jgi:hypothetical protein